MGLTWAALDPLDWGGVDVCGLTLVGVGWSRLPRVGLRGTGSACVGVVGMGRMWEKGCRVTWFSPESPVGPEPTRISAASIVRAALTP